MDLDQYVVNKELSLGARGGGCRVRSVWVGVRGCGVKGFGWVVWVVAFGGWGMCV